MAEPTTASLSDAQVRKLRAHGEEHTAAAGEILFREGDREYPFILVLDGEVLLSDPAGNDVLRCGSSEFLGELSLLSGQAAFLTAVATLDTRYLSVPQATLRQLLFEPDPLSDLLLAEFIARREALQSRRGIGLEVIGPHSSSTTRQLVDYLRRNRFVFTWTRPEDDPRAGEVASGVASEDLPIVRLPGGTEMRNPSAGELSRALGVGLELSGREDVDLAIVGGGPAGLAAAVYGASEGLNTLLVEANSLGGQAGASRRIENYLGFPTGISGTELTTRAVAQARKFGARAATPYTATGLEIGENAHIIQLDGGWQVRARAIVLATGAEYRRLPIADVTEYEGLSVFYSAGPAEAQACGAARVGVIGGGNSAGQAAVWLARGGALVTLLHRRATLAETMSHYLIRELDNFGVSIRDGSEVAELHGSEGQLEAVSLGDGSRLRLAFLFCFLGADPCTRWLEGSVDLDADGFIVTGAAAGVAGLLQTSASGVYAAGDVRAGSMKRCAAAVGEGATVVRMVHDRLAEVPA